MNAELMQAQQGRLHRWFIRCKQDHSYAWTGARWTKHNRGIPLSDFQVCNFPNKLEADKYIEDYARYEINRRNTRAENGLKP
jgi:hypothetical protein